MEGVIVLLVIFVLVGPAVALGLAIWSAVRVGKVEKAAKEERDSLRREMEHLRGLLRRRSAEPETLNPEAVAAPSPRLERVEVEPAPATVAPSSPQTPTVPPSEKPLPAESSAVATEAPTSPSEPPPPAKTIPAAGPMPPIPPAAPPPAKKETAGLEERLGARLFIWVGAVALALAGTLFVKYSIDQGWLSPTVRVTLGILFGAVLLGLGEWFRKPYALIAQACSAAGIADLFACFLAASSLYDLIPKTASFLLMALTAAVAVALSLRHGPLVAVVGLVGGFLTPYWLRTGDPRPAPLFAYLLMLQVGLLVVTRKRQWWPLAGLTLAAGMGWAAAWLLGPFRPQDGLWVGLFLLSSVAAFLASGFLGRAAEQWGDTRIPLGLGWAAMGSGLALVAALVSVSGYGTSEWLFLGLLGAACLVMGRLDASFEGTAWLAAGATALLLFSWGTRLEPNQLSSFLWTASALGALFAVGAFACLWGSVNPGRWASLSAASALGYFLILWGVGSQELKGFHWGIPALALAMVYTVGAIFLLGRRLPKSAADGALAALAVAVTAFVSLAVPLELERHWLTVAWALEVAALCWIATKLEVAILPKLAGLLAAATAVRLLLNPGVFTYPIGETPVFNWLLYGYGVPALAFTAAAFLAFGRWPRLSEGLQWGALAFSAALLGLETHHYFHPQRLDNPNIPLLEWGVVTSLWLGMALLLMVAARQRPLRSLEWGGVLLGLFSLGLALLAQGIGANPAWSHHLVGETFLFNRLLLVYGLPALLALLAAREMALQERKILPHLFGAAGLLLTFLLLTLEIRQAFRGARLDLGPATNAENYAYSAGWILFGVALLVVGIGWKSTALRYASLAVMILSIAKVFLYDLAHLKDLLLKSLSFLGLGVSLILVGFLYLRFVFRKEAP